MGLPALLHQTQFAKEHLLAPLAARRGRPRASPRAAPGQFRSGPDKKNSQAGKRGSGEAGGKAARGAGRHVAPDAPSRRSGRPRRAAREDGHGPGGAPRRTQPRPGPGTPAGALRALLRRELRKGTRRSRAREKKPASHAAAKAPSIPRGRSPRPRPRPPPPLAPESRVPAAPTVSAVRPLGAISSSPFCRLPRRAGAGPGAAVTARRSPLRRSFPEPGRATRAAPAARPPAPSTHLQLPALCRRTAGPRRAAFPRRPALSVGRPSPFAPPPEARGTPPARGCCGARRSPSGFAPCPKQRGARVSGIGSGTGGLTQPTVIDRRGDLLRRRSKPIVLLKCKGTFSPSRVLCTHTYQGYTSQVRCFRALLLPALPSPAPPRSRRQGLQLGSSLPMLSALTNRTFPAGSRQLGLEIKIGN